MGKMAVVGKRKAMVGELKRREGSGDLGEKVVNVGARKTVVVSKSSVGGNNFTIDKLNGKIKVRLESAVYGSGDSSPARFYYSWNDGNLIFYCGKRNSETHGVVYFNGTEVWSKMLAVQTQHGIWEFELEVGSGEV